MNLLLGVSGGIAAYKACELASLAVKHGHDVRVIMTANAIRFVGPLTFQGLTGHPPLTDTFSDGMAHITLAKWASCVVLAPATANLVAKLAVGLADDALTTTVMAVPGATPVIVAPAMNTEMWNHPATARNLRWLEELGRYRLISPVSKRLACGDVGVGGLADPTEILSFCEASAPPPLPERDPVKTA